MPPALRLKVSSWPNPSLYPATHLNIYKQLAITASSLIKPQTPAFSQFLLSFSLLRVIQREAELDLTSRS